MGLSALRSTRWRSGIQWQQHMAHHPGARWVGLRSRRRPPSAAHRWLGEFALESNPSDHLRTSTIFLSKSHTDVQKERKSNYGNHVSPGHLTKKYSSCSTTFLDDSTVSQHNLRTTVKCVASAICYHIKNRDANRSLDNFDERPHPVTRETVPEGRVKHDPVHKSVYRLVQTLFSAAQLIAKCTMVTSVYSERLLTRSAFVPLTGTKDCSRSHSPCHQSLGQWGHREHGWQPGPQGHCRCGHEWDERHFWEPLQFTVNVPASVYAKYCFDLRSTADNNHLPCVIASRSKGRTQNPEAISRLCEGWDLCRAAVRRSDVSADNVTGIQCSKASCLTGELGGFCVTSWAPLLPGLEKWHLSCSNPSKVRVFTWCVRDVF